MAKTSIYAMEIVCHMLVLCFLAFGFGFTADGGDSVTIFLFVPFRRATLQNDSLCTCKYDKMPHTNAVYVLH